MRADKKRLGEPLPHANQNWPGDRAWLRTVSPSPPVGCGTSRSNRMHKKLMDMHPVDDFVTQNTPGLKIWD